jgi:hypothetical protein
MQLLLSTKLLTGSTGEDLAWGKRREVGDDQTCWNERGVDGVGGDDGTPVDEENRNGM